ncbi:MAG: hypothetical protein ACE366_06625 [Bradymonadia bacterium]
MRRARPLADVGGERGPVSRADEDLQISAPSTAAAFDAPQAPEVVQGEIERLTEIAQRTSGAVIQADVWMQIGLLHLDGQHDPRRALAAFQKAHTAAPEHSPPLRISYALFAEKQQWPMALTILDSELRTPQTLWSRVRLLMLKGDVYRWHLDDLTHAVPCYLKALSLDPQHHPAARALAAVAADVSERKPVLQALEASIPHLEDHEEAESRRLAIAQLRLEDDPRDPMALAFLELCLEADPDHREALALKAACCWSSDRPEEAIAAGVRRAGTFGDDRGKALLRVAERALAGNAGPERIVAILEQVVEADPTSLPAWFRLANMYEAQHQWTKAAEALGQLAAFSPSSTLRAAWLTHRARILEWRLGRPDEAIGVLETAVAECQHWIPARRALERHLRRKGRWAEVATLIRQGLPLLHVPARQVARLCEMARIDGLVSGDVAGAVEACDVALERRPGHPMALNTRLLLEAKAGDWGRCLQTETMQPVSADHLRAIMRHWLTDAPEVASHRWSALIAARPDDLLALLHLDPHVNPSVDLEIWLSAVARAAEAVEDPWILGALIGRAADALVASDRSEEPEMAELCWQAIASVLKRQPGLPEVWSAALTLPLKAERLDPLVDGLADWLSAGREADPIADELWAVLEEVLWCLERPIESGVGGVERPSHGATTAAILEGWRRAVSGDAMGELDAMERLARQGEDSDAQVFGASMVALICADRLSDDPRALSALRRVRDLGEHPLLAWLTAQLCVAADTTVGVDEGVLAAQPVSSQWQCARRAIAEGEAERGLALLESMEARGGGPCTLELERLYRLLHRHRDLEFLITERLTEVDASEAQAPLLLERALVRGTHLRAPMGALEDLRQALKLIPGLPQARPWAEALVSRVGSLEDVDASLSEAEEDSGLRGVLLARRAQLLESQGALEPAVKAWEACLEVGTNALEAIQHLRQLYTRLGRGDEALSMLEREGMLVADPHEGAGLLLAAARVREKRIGDVDGALSLVAHALKREPGHEAHVEVARQMYGRYGRWGALAEVFEQLSEHVPAQRWDYTLEAARLYVHRLNRPEQAIKLLSGMLARANEHTPELLQQLADLYVDQEAWSEAATVYERLRADSPDEALQQAVTFRLAALYEDKLHDLERATQCLDALLKLDPTHPEASFRRANLAESRGDKALAAELLRRAASRITGPSRIKALQMKLGAFAEESGEIELAMDAYGRALEISPGDLEIAERVAALIPYKGMADRIFDLVEDAIKAQSPGSEERWNAMRRKLISEGLKISGANRRALREARRMAAEHPDDDRARLLYARSLTLHADAADQAEVHFRAVLERDPFHPEALKGLRRLSEQTGRMARAYQIALLLNGLQCGGADEQSTIARYNARIRRTPTGRLGGASEPALLDGAEQPSINLLLIELLECVPDILPNHPDAALGAEMVEGPLADLGAIAGKALGGQLTVSVIPGAAGRRVHYVEGRPATVVFPEGALRSVGRGERLFHMGRALHLGHRGLTRWTQAPSDASRRALAVALGADGDWSPFPPATGTLAEHAQTLQKGMGSSAQRRLRNVAEQVRALGGDPPINAALEAVKRSADRAGLLIAGSMLPAISVLTREAGVRPPGQGHQTAVLDALRGVPRLQSLAWWSLSDAFYALRARLGLDAPDKSGM